jgi:hypothetical protein
MSRARNIKPGFFKNDILAECDPLARLLFAGLWCEADRAGRLEDRPKRLKADCLPYDNCDVDALLNQLAQRGFIVRYVVDGIGYIEIPEFTKHQNPHCKESASSIPAPDKHSASTVQASAIPERATLIPDSPSLIPDSSKKQKRASQATPEFVPPAWVDPESWDAYVAMRRKARKAPTDRACQLVMTELIRLSALGHDPSAVLDQSTRNGWTDVYPLKGPTHETGSRNRKLSAVEQVEQAIADRKRDAGFDLEEQALRVVAR